MLVLKKSVELLRKYIRLYMAVNERQFLMKKSLEEI